MLGKRAEGVLNRAGIFAMRKMHEYVTVEHVLYSLLEETSIWDIIVAVGGNFESVKKEIENYLDKDVPKARKLTDQNIDISDEDLVEPPAATLGLQRLVQRAIFHVQSAGKSEVTPEDLFVALFQSKDSIALHSMAKNGLERLDVVEYLSHGKDLVPSDAQESADDDIDDEDGNNDAHEGRHDRAARDPFNDGRVPRDPHNNTDAKKNGNPAGTPDPLSDPLVLYTLALHELAKEGKIDPLIGRQNELDRVVQTLCRRRKNNPILVGEAGVGKTAIAEGLALKVVSGDVPDLLKETEIYSLDIGSLLAGAKFRGDFENRLKKVIGRLKKRKEKGKFVVLFIDEIHNVIGAGAVSGSSLDAANMLKPLLSRGEIHCIGSTTYTEYRNIFEKDHALSRRFQKIDIVEPSHEETVKILDGLRPQYEQHHGLEITREAIRAAVDLSVQHLNDRFLPDKAIDVMDEAGAKGRLRGKKTVDTQDIQETVAQIARIPERSVSGDQKTKLKSLDRDLKLMIFGQDHAVNQIALAIRLARSGLRTGEKPIGSFLFCGPTGVGKTELAKQLSLTMGIPFLRFDMSEYTEKHTVSRLIGAPPGYVGFEQAGLLTDAAKKNPHSVILLDEIEKAHVDVWNILLQVMDYGQLTDNNGKKSDFRNTIIIMTSNVGAREHERKPIGMNEVPVKGAIAKKEIEREFSPEFRNRLDAVIYFNPLDPITIAQVVGKQLIELETQLLAKSVEIEVDADAREWLAKKGYDKQMGARPLARLILDTIKKPLSEEILFGRLEHGGRVRVHLPQKADGGDKDGLAFEFFPHIEKPDTKALEYKKEAIKN